MAITKILVGTKNWTRLIRAEAMMLELEISLLCHPCPRQTIRRHLRRLTQEKAVPVQDRLVGAATMEELPHILSSTSVTTEAAVIPTPVAALNRRTLNNGKQLVPILKANSYSKVLVRPK